MNHDIIIEKAVLHVLDVNAGMPVISKRELNISPDLTEYIAKHIDKVTDDANRKNAEFDGEYNSFRELTGKLIDNEGDFLAVTENIANMMFEILIKNVDIPSGDLLCSLARIDGESYFAILKLNYKDGFTHWVNNSEEGSVNEIIRHQTLLPQEGQKLDEGVLISLPDMHIYLIEKQYEINGEKEFYLTKYILKCSCELSDNAKLKILNKVSKNVNKKYFEEDFEKAMIMKKAVSESLEEEAAIRIDKIADKVYEKNADIKQEYVQEIEKAGIIEKEIALPQKLIEKKFKTHRIKTDTGIEIDFPLEYADNVDRIEFINNPDGTLSIIIKNVGRITNK